MIKTDENGKELKEFKIGEILSVQKGYDISEEELSKEGNVAYIKAQTDNNGISTYIDFNKHFKRGISSVDVGRQGVCFIHTYPFFVSGNNLALIPDNDEITNDCLVYLSAIIGKKFQERSKTYGRLGLSRMKESEIFVPINDNGDPDWDYMGDYISNIERDYVDSVKSFNDRELRILDTIYADTESPGEPYEYKEFRVGDVFNVSTGSYCPGLEKGEVARISTKSTNNGILGYFDSSNYNGSRHEENCITVNFFGSDGGVFYHKNEVSLDLKVHALKPKDHDLNKEIALYLCSSLIKALSGYSYANQLSSSKLKKDDIFITLPSTPDGSIDWDYMEKYISNIAGGGRRRIDKWITSRNKEY